MGAEHQRCNTLSKFKIDMVKAVIHWAKLRRYKQNRTRLIMGIFPEDSGGGEMDRDWVRFEG